MFDVGAAFLNAEIENEIFIEWLSGIVELGLITKEGKEEYCIQLE
jgi:hypothetical protein